MNRFYERTIAKHCYQLFLVYGEIVRMISSDISIAVQDDSFRVTANEKAAASAVDAAVAGNDAAA